MRLSNGIQVYCKSMGKVFRVSHIAKDINEANEFMQKNRDSGIIAEDNSGLIYIAEFYGMTIKSNLLPD